MRQKIIFIVGPTASGKSKVAIKLAKQIKGEIISCDSMQIYKGLDILSAKPSQSDRRKIRHHLIDIIDPGGVFNVNEFIKLSKKLIEDIHKRKKIPIFVGGTGLYMDSLLNGLFLGPAKNPRIRDKLTKTAKTRGSIYLHNRLKKIDPQAAKKIHPNDIRRIIRALEVFEIAKKPISELQKKKKGLLQDPRYNIKIFGLDLPREKIYKNINNRVEEMFASGVIIEIKKILKKRKSQTFKQALGIKEITDYLKGRTTLDQAKDLLKKNTRRYAKRQLTWFGKNNKIIWLEGINSANIIIRKIVKNLS